MSRDTSEAVARIGASRVLPIATLDTPDQAAPLARALLEGGLSVVEITFRSEATADSIRIIRERYPDMLVGAGTVLNVEQVGIARRAGSQFILTPGFNPAVVGAAMEAGLPIFPGIDGPTGVEQAMGFGLETVKFFPAEAGGGVPFIKALSGPYDRMKFIPTGGIGPGNLAAYLALPGVLACGGSWIADPALTRAGRFDEVARLAAEAVALAAPAASPTGQPSTAK